MTSLDCNTPKGRISIEHQFECARRIEKNFCGNVFMTPDEESADVDAVAIKKHTVVAVLEIKSRNADLSQLRSWGTYLITDAKLEKVCRMSQGLRVPGYLFVYLLMDRKIVYWKICDKTGLFTVDREVGNTLTQATVNGGQVIRSNAYISLDKMKTLPDEAKLIYEPDGQALLIL